MLIGLSALALFVLITVQFMFVTDTYWTKQKQIDARYERLAREALVDFDNRGFDFAFDSVLFLLDNLALEYLFPHPDSVLQPVAPTFYGIISGYKAPLEYARDQIVKAGEDPNFTLLLHLKELILMDADFGQRVYPDSLVVSRVPDGSILVGSHVHERNFFRISYETHISLKNRTKLVLNEMRLVLALSIFTLVLVFTVFYMTLRNMLRQKRLSEMKTDFINNMTHELKTPLSTISVASSTLGNPVMIRQDKKVEELSSMIRKQNKHLAELIDRILDINIWERDQVKLKKQPVRTETWIRELTAAFLQMQDGKCTEVALKVDFPSGSVHMDEVHMSTAINNLLSNAVKYGHSDCHIGVNLVEHSGSMVITVSDNGPGIRKEELKHIFEKFYRGRESRERVIKGLGLGLYYVKQIVEAHHGSISARSTPGKGAQFIIKIPVNHEHPAG